ncbi:glycoside hydrolase family 65 protein [Sporosarcina pasteurii]|uniref:Kojibiose phosphorylase n=1 Tax=Sporosarcina pasteurii TaxID=1474 RepID=A0A380BDQ3_SPOPA|nr:glycosyl hydrolase family 65 protein [Sporosarcina pasteurii]MDS9472461.1 glycosyl hydrolase family 65 protein [Sporosarcina pasteurii]QBQ06017.1 glycoside hydrolase family 65 protein [Sporosarcina pasteurii]SUI99665.1 Kojibiose phosphorylase [Sporosarcina pasteurii]
MTWKITKSELDNENLLLNESLLSLGNGYLGVRGNFEEGYQDEFNSIRGTYINAYHDEIEIKYGEKLHAFPDIQQKLLNVIDSQGIQIYLDDERFSLFEGEVIHFERTLHMDSGFAERIVHWKSPTGKEVKLTFKRLVSFKTKELFAIDVEVEPISGVQQVKIISTVNGDVTNFVDPSDPRVAAGNAKRLHILNVSQNEKYSVIKNRTYETKLDVACVTSSTMHAENYGYDSQVTESHIEEIYEFEATGPVHFTKYNVYTDTLRHGENVIEKGLEIQRKLNETSFSTLLQEQQEYLDNYWRQSDVKIDGDEQLQEGIRFNLYQLLQSVGKDPVSNIAAKGLSGEGYEGHYFWDTEIYMFPVFLMTHPEIAKNLLVHRYSLLDSARKRAKEMGHKKGALFPWRTITGQESSAFFPAGTAQYHISADIAYSYIQYYLVTQDEDFLKEYMAEMLFETARLWNDTGHMQNGEFRIDSVTGPDEYTCVVNNNYYTNVMAKHNLSWAVKVFHLLKEKEQNKLNDLMARLSLSEGEVSEWLTAAENMYLPYDEELKINAQDDSFLQKDRWDLENTPEDKFPLLLNYHPLTLYRYQVIKQADTVLAHFLLEDEQDLETIKNSYDYYEELTTHDSSLSCSIYGIMASKLGYDEKAYNYFIETARLDLDNTQGNTKDGLHMANMGGTWLALVYGFAGLRVKETGLYFAPTLPEAWNSLSFNIRYQGRILNVHLERDAVTYTIVEGEELTISHHGQSIHLENGVEAKVETEYSS